MILGLIQTLFTGREDDIATGTYADGAAGTPPKDLSGYAERRRATTRLTAEERDYAQLRAAVQMGAGMTA